MLRTREAWLSGLPDVLQNFKFMFITGNLITMLGLLKIQHFQLPNIGGSDIIKDVRTKFETSDVLVVFLFLFVCDDWKYCIYLQKRVDWLLVSIKLFHRIFMRPHRGYYIDKTQRLQVDYRVARNSPKTSFTFGLEHLADNTGNTSQF